MVPWIKAFFFDETAFKRFGRGLFFAAAPIVTAWQIDGQITWGTLVSALCAMAGGSIGVGQKKGGA